MKLLRRHKYLQKIFEEELTHILKFLKGFTDDQCRTLACFTTLVILEGLAPTTVLRSLLNEYLTKEGIALQFLTSVFRVWLQEREIGNLSFALKKANLEGKLLVSQYICFEYNIKRCKYNNLIIVIMGSPTLELNL